MEDLLSKTLEILKTLKIKPVIYGSFGVSYYVGKFKKFGDLDLLIEEDFVNNKWKEFKELFESNGFRLVDEKEHEFKFNKHKVGFASKNILIRDKIINDYSELIQCKYKDALILKPEDFLRAYMFSVKDGYRINTRNKKDNECIKMLEDFIKKIS